MRTIYGISEALLDIVFKNNRPIDAVAGGSTLNSLVSLGRIGHNPKFICEIGNDKTGKIIEDFFVNNGVSLDFVTKKENYQTPVALAFLNENNDAEYEIFKDYDSQSLTTNLPLYKRDDILLIGSFFALNPSLRKELTLHLDTAKNSDSIIIYDPNFRSHHTHKVDVMKNIIEDNFSFANIVRGSDEDFKNIYGINNVEEIAKIVHKFSPNVVITANSKQLFLSTPKFQKWYPVKEIEPVSTIGAGDSFNAGIIQGIISQNISCAELNSIKEKTWDKIIEYGIEFSSDVCCSTENYISNSLVSKLLNKQL